MSMTEPSTPADEQAESEPPARVHTGPLPRFETPIVPKATIAGRALVAVIAIMTFLASLTTGAVMLVRAAAVDWQSEVSREITVQIRPTAGRDIEADVVLPMLGFHSDIGALAEWGLNCEKDEIVVNSLMETGRLGIYAAGDITTYPGKLKLIATGFGEAATAVNQAVHWIYPDKKVNPGHSSNMAIFGQKDD